MASKVASTAAPTAQTLLSKTAIKASPGAIAKLTHNTPPHKTATEVGVVVSAGLMQRAVKVRTTQQKTNTYLRTRYTIHPTHLVADPADSVRAGDVVRIAAWPRPRGRVQHVVTEIVRAFGPPADQRPAIPSLDELAARRDAKVERKRERRAARRAAQVAAEAALAGDGEPGLVVEGAEEAAAVAAAGQRKAGVAQGRVEGLLDDSARMEAEAEEGGVDLDKRMENVRL